MSTLIETSVPDLSAISRDALMCQGLAHEERVVGYETIRAKKLHQAIEKWILQRPTPHKHPPPLVVGLADHKGVEHDHLSHRAHIPRVPGGLAVAELPQPIQG